MKESDIFIYLVTVNQHTVDINRFAKFITNHHRIYGFWNYLPFVYAFKTDMFFHEFTDDLRRHFNHHQFMVAKIDPYFVDGWLPKEAWEWFAADLKQLPPTSAGLQLPRNSAGLEES